MRTFIPTFIGLFLLLSSCGMEGTGRRTGVNGTSSSASLGKNCICNFFYDPVCGRDGKTYENACFATCFEVQYTPGGTCLDQGICDINSGVVCGLPPNPSCANGEDCEEHLSTAKTYANECALGEAGAKKVDMSSCSATSNQ